MGFVFSLVAASRASPSSWSRLPTPLRWLLLLRSRAPGRRDRELRPEGCGARLSCSAVCGVFPDRALPVSAAPAGGFSIAEPPGKRPFCSFLLSRLPLPHRLLIIFLCVFSFIDTHSSKLTRHPVPGALCPVCRLWSFGGPSRTGFYLPPPPPTPPPPPSGTSHHVIQLFSLAYVLVHSGCPNEVSPQRWRGP